MENASKALIIAGAILLAIVIISLGLIVVNNVRDVTDNTNLSEQEIQSFNAKFIAYEGDNVSGSRVNSLIQQVISTNQASQSDGKSHFVTICYLPSSWTSSYAILTTDSNGKIKVIKAGPARSGGVKVDYTTASGDSNVVKNARDDGDDSGITGKLDDYTSSGIKVSTSVKTEATYKVKAYYKNGLVKCIIVNTN